MTVRSSSRRRLPVPPSLMTQSDYSGLVTPPAGGEELRHNAANNNINCLSRSNTFSSGSETRPGSRLSPRRRLPQIPPRAFSVTCRDKLSPEQSYSLCSGEASHYTEVRSYEDT